MLKFKVVETFQGGTCMFCFKCNAQLSDEAIFCPYCGVRLKGEAKEFTAKKEKTPRDDFAHVYSENSEKVDGGYTSTTQSFSSAHTVHTPLRLQTHLSSTQRSFPKIPTE